MEVAAQLRADRLVADHPATAASRAATATAAIGATKLPVCLVTRPTAHMAGAPANDPLPPSSPAAVDTWAAETSWAIVRYMLIQTPIAKFTTTSAATAPLRPGISGAAADSV